jgi:chromosome segregation ATPase
MVSGRSDTAVKSLESASQLVERYTRLSRAYLKLTERFNQLDVEHMKLKGKIVPLLKSLENSQNRVTVLEGDCESLQDELKQQEERHKSEIQSLILSYEERIDSLNQQVSELKPLEALFSQEARDTLAEAEAQIDLMETTFAEMEEDSSPDLSREDKSLLDYYLSTPSEFLIQQ